MKKLKATNGVTYVLMGVFAILFLVLFGRLVYIQASGEIEGENLITWAEKQRTSSYDLPAERGKIYDRTGMVLADNRPTYRLYAVLDEEYTTVESEPRHVEDIMETAQRLAPYLHLEENALAQLLEEAKNNDKFQVEFRTINISEKQKQEIEDLKLPGIYFSKQLERYYPNGIFASHLIGFTQKKDESIEGVMGIESAWNDQLTGVDGHITFKRDKFGYKLLEPEETVLKAEDGDHVYLTIDQKIQTFLEDALSQVQEQYDPKRVIAVVMNPKTGEILGMSNRPSFDPNIRENIQNWYNDVISYPFEPGSTMKIFTLSAAIDSGVYDGDEIYQSGTYKYLDNVPEVNDHNYGKGWGPITYDEGFQRSSNVAMAKLVWEKMGTETFLEYLKRFDFDQITGIDLPGEIKGKIMFEWPAEKVTTSFGQGTTVTPMQLLKAATAVVNDGKMVKPYVISKIVDSSTGKVLQETEPEFVGQPIKATTASQVMDLLESVVTSEAGTGKSYFLEDFTVAGKTGTAQIVDPETGKYLRGKEDYIFSFLGMAPADNPELMIYVAVKQPKLADNEIGSEPVSFIFKTVMENSLHYLEIKPDKKDSSINIEPIAIPSHVGESVQTVKQKLQAMNLTVKVIGNGNYVTKIYPDEGTELIPGSLVILVTDGKIGMPNITGWSLREVFQLGQLLQLQVDFIGNGFVIKQSIPIGADLTEDQYLTVELQPPGINEEEQQIENDEDMQEIED